MKIIENEPMSNHTSFRVGGPARYMLEVCTKEDVSSMIQFIKDVNLPHFLLGNGTNLLVSDEGFDGVVVTLGGAYGHFAEDGCGNLSVGAGMPLGRIARTSVKKGLSGIHKLAGIPGTVGGAVYMNAGAYGQEFGQFCTQVESVTLDGEIIRRSQEECKFSYRHSIFQELAAAGKPEIILSANLCLAPVDSLSEIDDMEAEIRELAKKRASSQPLNMPNAGSTFKRLNAGAANMPEQVAPGYYIEQAGLKGFRIGGAEVSQVHANFIVNAGGATATDIKQLSEHMQKTVAEKFGVQLQREIILLGF